MVKLSDYIHVDFEKKRDVESLSEQKASLNNKIQEEATMVLDEKISEEECFLISKEEVALIENEMPRIKTKKDILEKRNDYFERFHRHLNDITESAKSGAVEDLEPLIETMEYFLSKEKMIEKMYSTAMTSKVYPDDIITHSVNCTILSVMIGKGLKYSSEKLLELTVSILLHDVGMAFSPRSLIEKKGKLSTSEFRELKKHPEHGYRYLKKSYPDRPYIALTAYHDHEREDGSGYGQGLKGKEIFEYAKICGVLDIFEALTHDRPNRKRMLPFQAIQNILHWNKNKFTKPVLKALISRLSVYPKFSYVKLNTRAIAQVIEVDDKFPLRPILKIVLDSTGERMAGEHIVDLKQNSLLYIIESDDGSSLSN